MHTHCKNTEQELSWDGFNPLALEKRPVFRACMHFVRVSEPATQMTGPGNANDWSGVCTACVEIVKSGYCGFILYTEHESEVQCVVSRVLIK